MEDYEDILIYRIGALENAVESSRSVKTVFIVYSYIIGVRADGILGYLYGYAANQASQLIISLEEIGAPMSIKIVQDVFAFFPDSTPANDIEERAMQIAQIVKATGSEDPWEDLNRKFAASSPDLEIQLSAYVHKHRELLESFPEDNDQKQLIARVMKKMKRR